MAVPSTRSNGCATASLNVIASSRTRLEGRRQLDQRWRRAAVGTFLEQAVSSTRSRGGGSIGGISGGSMAAMLTVVKPAVPASSGDGSSISGDAGLPWEPFWNRLPP